MKIVYPTLIKESGSDYLVYVPDMDIYTEGKDFCNAIEMARDAIGLRAINYEDDNIDLPCPSKAEEAIKKAKEEADDIFDYSNGTLTFVDVDTLSYRAKVRNLSVKKNCSIPAWLNEKAEKQGVNFSRVLQDALVEIVGTR